MTWTTNSESFFRKHDKLHRMSNMSALSLLSVNNHISIGTHNCVLCGLRITRKGKDPTMWLALNIEVIRYFSGITGRAWMLSKDLYFDSWYDFE